MSNCLITSSFPKPNSTASWIVVNSKKCRPGNSSCSTVSGTCPGHRPGNGVIRLPARTSIQQLIPESIKQPTHEDRSTHHHYRNRQLLHPLRRRCLLPASTHSPRNSLSASQS